MLHAARQLPSWLTFNVSQILSMRLLVLLVILVETSVTKGAETSSNEADEYTAAAWKVRIDRMRGFDEIRMFEAESVRYVPKIESGGKLTHHRRVDYDRQVFTVSDIPDGDAVLAMLTFLPNQLILSHGCRGLFNLVFLRKGEEVASLHFAHGKYWAPLTQAAQLKLNEWLTARGFPVARLLRKEANQSVQPTTGSVTPRATEATSK
jgi:hypothetical protein